MESWEIGYMQPARCSPNWLVGSSAVAGFDREAKKRSMANMQKEVNSSSCRNTRKKDE